ncbi:MAG: T9SS type A sorting domain-containing protein [Flavobacteriales bacterium]|nr:T9SS type A sorting domain-containing protein [Flavobacteriales bacterium]
MRWLLASLFVMCTGHFSAQSPPIGWQALIGGSGGQGEWLVPLPDGSLIGLGTVETSQPGITGYHPGGKIPTDMWVFKLSPDGELLWEQAIGGSEMEQAYQMIPTSDGGVVIAGQTRSSDGDVTGHHGNVDIWLVKFSGGGQLLWERALGGSEEEFFYLFPQNYEMGVHLLETQDQGIALLAHTSSADGDVVGAHSPPGTDIWLVKLDSDGGLLWQRCLGGSSDDRANAMVETASGALVLAGSVGSADGDVTGHHGQWDIWVACLSAGGELLWQRALGGSLDEQAYDLTTTADGGLVLCGSTTSTDGDVDDAINTGNIWDAWVVKLTADGSIDWKRCLGGTQGDYATHIHSRPDGSNLVLLISTSTDIDMAGAPPGIRAWVMSLDATGEIEWATGYGNGAEDSPVHPVFRADGGCVMMFPIAAAGDDLPPEFGTGAVWLVSMDGAGNVEWQHSYGGSSFEWGHHLVGWPDGRLAFTGHNQSTDGDLASFPPDHYTLWVCTLGDMHTGAEDVEEQHLIIVQDMTGAALRITIPRLLGSAELSLYDTHGRLQRSDRMAGTDATMDLRGLASGAYVLVVRAQEVTHRQRIVVP